MTEERKAAPISLKRRQAPQPNFDRISEVAAALSSQDNQYPPAARDVVARDRETMVESAEKDTGASMPTSEPASVSPAHYLGQAQTNGRPAAQGALSRRVRVRCEADELRALRAYAALKGVALSDLLSEALKPLVEKAVIAMRQ